MVKTLLKKNKVKNGVLKNGLRYVLNDNDTFSSCCILFYIRVGSMHETPKEYGISHILEHMLFKGTDIFGSLDFEKEAPLINKIEGLLN